MAKTLPGTSHRHKDSHGKWTTSEQPHTHTVDVASFTGDEVKTMLSAAGWTGGGTVPPPPPTDTTAPTIGTPVHTALTQTSITIAWTTNEPATGQIEYGTTTSYGSTTTLDSTLTTSKSQPISGLSAGTVYFYRIRAADAATNLGTRTGTFTTTAAPPSPPPAPTGLAATPGNTTVSLSWNAVSGATYKVYRNAVFLANSSSTSYTATGLTNGVAYTFTVSAVTGGGEGAQSSGVTATPTSPPTDTTPPVVSNVTETGVTQTGITIGATTNEPATVVVEYGTTTGYGSTTSATSLGTSHSRNLSGLTAGTLYHYRVRATDPSSNVGYSSDDTFTTTAAPPALPAAPTGLAAGPGNTAIQLTWNAIAGTTYSVYRNVSGGSYTLRTSGLSSPSFYDTGLTNGTLYGYKVSATNGAGEGAQSGAVTATPTAPSGNSVTVTSIAQLKSSLANNAITEIIVANGTYAVSGASGQAANSLWIGSAYVSRTNPITIRAQTIGGVTFDGGGGANGMLSFNGGAHDQTWEGFVFANSLINQTGVIMFAGYTGSAAPYNITLRNFHILASVRRVTAGGTNEHAVYFSSAPPPYTHDILIENLTVEATDAMGLATGIHHDHGYASDAPELNAHHVTIRNLVFHGNGTAGASVQAAIIPWQPTIHDWLFDGATITNTNGNAVRFESIGASNIVFKDITSTGSRNGGFYSSMGANPPGVTKTNCSFG